MEGIIESKSEQKNVKQESDKERIAYLEEKLAAQSEMLSMTSDYMKKTQRELTAANKHLKDSIHSARRIQDALVPSEERLQRVFPGAFVLYLPKDELSGDIFWVRNIQGRRMAAAIDCTGHGVPGAMLTVLVISLLNQIVSQNIGVLSPAQILEELHRLLSAHTHNYSSRRQVRDGLDLALITWDKESQTVEYAGAKRPLYLLRNKKMTTYKGTRISIGDDKMSTKSATQIENHKIPVQSGDWIYLCSDGYHDQFGGPDNFKMMQRRFRYLLAGNAETYRSGDQQQRGLLEYFYDWKDGHPQIDDVLVLGIPF